MKEYRNTCWNCNEYITEENAKCSSCGWYICSNCGRCEPGCCDLNANPNLFDKTKKLADLLQKRGKVDFETIFKVFSIITEQDYAYFKKSNPVICEIAKSVYKEEPETLKNEEKEKRKRVEEDRMMLQRGFFRVVKKTDDYVVFKGPFGYDQITKDVDSVHGDYISVDDPDKCLRSNYYLEKKYSGLIKSGL